MFLIVDVALVALIALALWVATRRGRARAKHATAVRAVSDLADLIPGRAVGAVAVRPPPRVVPGAAASRATWSASSERGETTPRVLPVAPEVLIEPAPVEPAPVEPAPVEPAPVEPAPVEPAPVEPAPVEPAPPSTDRVDRAARPAVVVAPRGRSWVVRRDGASRVSSVHASRDAAEARARKTARRERVVLEVRDVEAALLERTDYSAGEPSLVGSTEAGAATA